MVKFTVKLIKIYFHETLRYLQMVQGFLFSIGLLTFNHRKNDSVSKKIVKLNIGLICFKSIFSIAFLEFVTRFRNYFLKFFTHDATLLNL